MALEARHSADRNLDYPICASGTMQSPINLSGAFSKVYTPAFKYNTPALGTLSNSGYGPSYTLNSTTGAPTFTTGGTDYYLLGFVSLRSLLVAQLLRPTGNTFMGIY